MYLRALQGKRIKDIACGSDKTICIVDGDTVRGNIGLTLLCESEFMTTMDMSDEDVNEVSQIFHSNIIFISKLSSHPTLYAG